MELHRRHADGAVDLFSAAPARFIDQTALARSFAERYERTRGYGPAMHRLLWEIKCGEDWAERAQSLFAGQGSFGNGAAMRVAPLGAFFAHDLDKVVEQAALSSVITHMHDEAIAGGIVAAYTGFEAIPEEWLKTREPLPVWPFTE